MLKPSKSYGYATGENLAECFCFKVQGLLTAKVAPFSFGQDFFCWPRKQSLSWGKESPQCDQYHLSQQERCDFSYTEAENGGHSEQFCHKDREREKAHQNLWLTLFLKNKIHAVFIFCTYVIFLSKIKLSGFSTWASNSFIYKTANILVCPIG